MKDQQLRHPLKTMVQSDGSSMALLYIHIIVHWIIYDRIWKHILHIQYINVCITLDLNHFANLLNVKTVAGIMCHFMFLSHFHWSNTRVKWFSFSFLGSCCLHTVSRQSRMFFWESRGMIHPMRTSCNITNNLLTSHANGNGFCGCQVKWNQDQTNKKMLLS